MAKIRIYKKGAKRWKGFKVMTGPKKISSKVEIYRSSQVGAPGPFMACVRIGKGQTSKRSGYSHARKVPWQACASGKNPRRAIGRALAKIGRKVAGRSGAFAGLR